MPFGTRRIFDHDWTGPTAVAVVAFLAVCLTSDPTGDYPLTASGPGITVDESFNVRQGLLLAEAVSGYGIWILDPVNQRDVFRETLNDHPPLGRLWIGLAEKLARNVFPPANSDALYSTAAARTASASAFAFLVFLVGYVAVKWYGRLAGVVAAVTLLLMPRVFGHAHVASLESTINLTFVAAVLAVTHFWHGEKPPTARTACLTGLLFGLALLSKVQAIFIPIPIAVWALIQWRQRALVPLILWGGAGLLVFYAGWPHLWDAPVDHLLQYLGRTTKRIELHNWYLGRQIADRETPWHYPAVMFLTTVPLGLHILAGLGVAVGGLRIWKSPRELLLLGTILLPLFVFSLPGTPVYDGARLFLVVFPFWAVFAGQGGQVAFRWLATHVSAVKARWCLSGFLALQAYGVIFLAPCWLSYYNVLVGGLRGADRLGMERTYWSDSLTRDFLQEAVENIPRGATIYVAPVLHQFQLPEMVDQSPLLRTREIKLKPYTTQPLDEKHFLLVYLRRADLTVEVEDHWQVIAEVRRENVVLTRLYGITANSVKSRGRERF